MRNAPELLMGLELFWTAFWALTRERSAGLGISGIPVASMRSYAHDMELDEEQTEDLLHHVMVLDSAFLKYHRREAEKRQKQKS